VASPDPGTTAHKIKSIHITKFKDFAEIKSKSVPTFPVPPHNDNFYTHLITSITKR
jgi:hypothetical protein